METESAWRLTSSASASWAETLSESERCSRSHLAAWGPRVDFWNSSPRLKISRKRSQKRSTLPIRETATETLKLCRRQPEKTCCFDLPLPRLSFPIPSLHFHRELLPRSIRNSGRGLRE